MTNPLKVAVFNDSATMRATLRSILEGAGMRVVAERSHGGDAVSVVREHTPDVILMDVIMPGVDGYEATRAIMSQEPRPILMLSSVVDARDSEVVFRALSAGAVHMAEPPRAGRGPAATNAFIALVRTIAGARRTPPVPSPAPAAPPSSQRTRRTIDVVGIVASAGGPAALLHVLGGLRGVQMPPILICQHLAPGFAHTFASWLSEATGYSVQLAEHGAPAAAGVAWMPPDDRHLGIDGSERLVVSGAAPIRRFRPSANFLFRSLAHFGTRALGVVLSGMGDDGVEGAQEMTRAGAKVIAQDRESSAVWGMPGAAVRSGAVSTQLSVTDMAGWLREKVNA